MDLRTRDQRVRDRIDAVKRYLEAEGFADVEELLTKAFEGLRTLLMIWQEHRRILRLSYSWLDDHEPAAVREWLPDRAFRAGFSRIAS